MARAASPCGSSRSAVRRRRGFGDHLAVGVRQDGGGLACVEGGDGVGQVHVVEDLFGDSAHVDVLAAVAEGVGALDGGDLSARASQPVRDRHPGDAHPGHQCGLCRHDPSLGSTKVSSTVKLLQRGGIAAGRGDARAAGLGGPLQRAEPAPGDVDGVAGLRRQRPRSDRVGRRVWGAAVARAAGQAGRDDLRCDDDAAQHAGGRRAHPAQPGERRPPPGHPEAAREAVQGFLGFAGEEIAGALRGR
jgi:hypothetical protein